jgi:3-octaprenyl-4-hydroxybenzoate carboxy-lyase
MALPLFRLNHGDGGFYIDKAVTISRDMDDRDNPKTQNVGLYRLQVKGKTRIGIQPVPAHDVAIHLGKAEERGGDSKKAASVGGLFVVRSTSADVAREARSPNHVPTIGIGSWSSTSVRRDNDTRPAEPLAWAQQSRRLLGRRALRDGAAARRLQF